MSDHEEKHFIKRIIFDLDIERKEDAQRIQDEISRIFNVNLTRLLDKLLTEFSIPEHLIRIDTLTFDLGEIKESEMGREVMLILEKKLREYLTNLKFGFEHSGKSRFGDAVVEEEELSKAEILGHYLLYGFLPSGISLQSFSVEDTFKEMLENNPGGLAALVKDVATRNSDVVKRIRIRFSERLVALFLAVVADENIHYINAWKRDTEERLRAKMRAPFLRINEFLLEEVLRILLTSDIDFSDQRAFEGEMLKQIARKLGEEAVNIILEVKPEEKVQSKDISKVIEDYLALIRRILKSPVRTSEKMKVLEALSYLLLAAPARIREVFQGSSPTLSAIRALVGIAPDEDLTEIIVMLSGEMSEDALEYISSMIMVYSSIFRGEGQSDFRKELYSRAIKVMSQKPESLREIETLAKEISKEIRKISNIPSREMNRLADFSERIAENLKESRVNAEKKAEEIRKKLDEEGTAEAEKEGSVYYPRKDRSWLEEMMEFMGEPLAEGVKPIGLDTASARLEIASHYLETGKMPWWIESYPEKNIGNIFYFLQKHETDKFRRIIRKHFARGNDKTRDEITKRLIVNLDEVPLQELMQNILPGISGFALNLARVLRQAAKTQPEIVSQSRSDSPLLFTWQPLVYFLVEYSTSSPSASDLVKFTIAYLAGPDKEKREALVRSLKKAVTDLVSAGDGSVRPLMHMIPSEPGVLEPSKPEPLFSPEELKEFELEAIESIESREPMEDFAEEEATETEKKVEIAEEEKADNKVIGKEKEKEKAEKEEKEKKEEKLTPEEKTRKEEERKKEEIEKSEKEKISGKEIIEGKEKPEKEELTEEDLEELRFLREEKAPVYKEGITESEERGLSKILPPEGEEISEPDKDSPFYEVLGFYLLYGYIPSKLRKKYPKKDFIDAIREALRTPDRGLILTLRKVLEYQSARIRLIKLNEEVTYSVIEVVNLNMGEAISDLVSEMVGILGERTGQVSKTHALDHALLYAAVTHSSTFRPVHYFRHFNAFVTKLYPSLSKNFIPNLIKRVDESSSSLAEPIADVLKSIERTMETEKRRKEREDELFKDRPKKVRLPSENEEMYVKNAGMVVASPFFLPLFTKLELLDEEKKFKDEEAMSKAIYILQYLATREEDTPEEELMLNKVIVGMSVSEPIPFKPEITEQDKELVEGLLEALIARWPGMKGQKTNAIRGGFMMREGRLKLKTRSTDWELRVEQRGFDVLLNKLTYSIGQLKYPWNEYIIYVEWA